MNENLRQMVIEALRRGEELLPEWETLLFPPKKREYELTYAGKAREEEIIADTLAVPLQPVRTFGSAPEGAANADGWQNKLIFGDNLQALKTLLELKQAGKLLNADGTPGVRLVYIDPPFATKQDFNGSQEEKAYRDKIAGAEFLEFLRRRLVLLRELLSANGSIYLHLDSRRIHYIKVLMDEIFGESNFRSEIVWKRTSAHSDSKTLANVHDTILLYSRTQDAIFHPQYREYDEQHVKKRYRHIDGNGRRFSDGDLVAKGLRGGGYVYEWKGVTKSWRCPPETMKQYESEDKLYYTRNGVARIKRYLDEMPGQPPSDVWLDIFPVNSQAEERINYPTQKSETLLERVILSSSNSGDIVLDAFAGSGTTCAVAEKLGRRWIAIDCGKLAVYTVQKRILSLKEKIGQKGKALTPQPFTLYNAGLYDFSALRRLPWQDWRFFALQLFGCRDEPHTIGGLLLDGKRQGASVLVFNHLEQPGRRIDEDTIQSIHAAIGDKVGSRFFIVAPRGVFDFQQDYIDLEGVRYYALRIPYSFINELHHREFTALKQPADEMDVNAIVDAVGFDFIRPPDVKWKTGVATANANPKSGKPAQQSYLRDAYLEVESFESRAYIRGEDTRGGLETLSLVLVDLDYDGDVFVADQVRFAAGLKNDDWRIRLDSSQMGSQGMVVFIDIYGNEAREIIRPEMFGLPAPAESVAASEGV